MTNDEVQILWQRYFESKVSGNADTQIQRKLVEHYYPLVKKVAIRVHQRITDVDVDELTSMGVDGLYDSIANYNPEKKTKFETYAPTRIRGSMLDGVRNNDWVPRLVRAKSTILEKKRRIVESQLGHHATNAEMAKSMGMTIEDYEELHQSAATPGVHHITEGGGAGGSAAGDGDSSFSIEHLEDEGAAQPVTSMIREELWHHLLGKNFTPQERQIMWLYYREDRSMKEISEIVRLSESRVSQMHTMILRRLEQKVKRNPTYYSDIGETVGRFREPEAV